MENTFYTAADVQNVFVNAIVVALFVHLVDCFAYLQVTGMRIPQFPLLDEL